ncbi:PIH1 domain-containing protein 1 [Anabarilius grahami]|uniref:PIH1 domain-containing protein 1 n=1 Tax=Anabarilius grahami TaxID=495550 RepID=A0A3N0XEA6_ANAGA|nr:PIH1 domain-containing protein 1 [Anabarilius grahami]
MGKMQNDSPPSKVIRPQPGMCVKTSSVSDKQKVFLNICQSQAVPPPPHLSQEALVKLLESEDPTSYRVPMSLGEPHTEVDNSSQGCTVYDVVINDEFFQKCQNDTLFQQFLIAVSLEGLENKYNLELSRDIKILKNRKFMGSVAEQNIRTKSKPIIQEIDSKEPHSLPSSIKRPEFTLLVEPPSGNAEYLIAEILLPGVISARSIVLDLGEDRLVLIARPTLFHLDIFFPLLIDQENSVAQYNTKTQKWKAFWYFERAKFNMDGGKYSKEKYGLKKEALVRVKVTSTWMAGPKVSKQNIAQSITLPLPDCLLPIFHPGAMCSPVLMLTCPLLALSAVDRGQYGQYAAMQPHMQQTLSYSSSSVGSDHTGQPSLPTCINVLSMTLSPVHHCSFLGPLLIDTDHCRPGTPHKSCSFGDALTQSSSHHNLALIKPAQILTLAHFSCF